MPSKTSFPMNLTRTNNNVSDSRTGANWKDISGTTPSTPYKRGGNPTAKIVTVGLYRPDHNKQYTLGYYGADKPENTNDANAFRARPLKHYRKQYGNNNNKQTNYRGNLITDVFETPGGNIVKNYSDVNCDDANAPGVLLVPNYSLKEVNQFNKVGKSGNSTTVTFDPNNTNQTKEFYNFKTCLKVCDPPTAARRRTQYQTNINVNPAKNKYYQTSKSYLESRCKTLAQNQGTGSKIAGKTYEYNSTSCYSTNANCKKLIHKPSNNQYQTQGAVSSGSRITRLKLNTIQTAANNSNVYNLGTAVQNAFAYSGRAEAPFTVKTKFQSNQFYRNFHISRKGGQGNHTTSGFCSNSVGNVKITELQRQTKDVRTSGVGSRTLNGVV